jgi:2-hydroxychromene-2-carboxylate isomerase
MAEVIQLTRRRIDRMAPPPPAVEPATVYFDLALPSTYLVAERIERRFGEARWRPATLRNGPPEETEGSAFAMEAAERRARELRMPLVWPERFPARVPSAMRVATFAAECGCAGAFAVAVGRLAFCGGFDVEDPDILAEAAAAAGLEVGEALDAARDLRRDRSVAAAGRTLWAQGGTQLPTVEVEGTLYCGEPRITVVLARTAMLARPFAS